MNQTKLLPFHYLYCFMGICIRETTRFLYQYPRLIASIVRPLLWFFIFTAGFRGQWLELSDVSYQVYVIPGLIAMVLLFHAMSSSLSMVYDREMGSMRLLLSSPFPRNYLLFCKVVSNTFVSMIQVAIFLCVVAFFGADFPLLGYFVLLPLLFFSGIMLGMFGLFLSSFIHQMESFAGVINFVIFPLFFASTALYPLEHIIQGSHLIYTFALFNPLTYVVELLRAALLGGINSEALIWVVSSLILFTLLAFYSYSPKRSTQ